MIREKLKQRIKFCIVITIIAIAIAVAIFTVMIYEVEGEKVVPYDVKKIIVISSASVLDANDESINDMVEANDNDVVNEPTPTENAANTENVANVENTENTENAENVENTQNTANAEDIASTENTQNTENTEQPEEEENYIWKKNVIQTNDICIMLDKNEEYKEEETIKNVKIDNIQILQGVKVGKTQVYMPNSLDDGMYKYTKEYLVNNSLTYTGGASDDRKNLQIRNQGGCIYISFANVGLDQYKSNEDQEIQQGAYILEKMNLANDDLKFKVSFDLTIEVQDMTYKTNIILDLPVDGVVGQKETHTEITDLKNLVFKRQ